MTEPAYPPDERALLDAILADPDDDDRRLVYADWLEERGDPRAEWVRGEVALHRAEYRRERHAVEKSTWLAREAN